MFNLIKMFVFLLERLLMLFTILIVYGWNNGKDKL